ncbi:hypothetical protein [Ralstonia chuxiongensis]|uniref:hypothetical protein n=1 Tax=Ralstonia chuxiongensis TaxID=2957504 RepID=UPI0028F62E4A|nr:hypothetical protein [Ralstonia chuxiongensis]CAJ0777668.1 hypothetical protein R8510_04395 [Ralstonia chuxiongensis]
MSMYSMIGILICVAMLVAVFIECCPMKYDSLSDWVCDALIGVFIYFPLVMVMGPPKWLWALAIFWVAGWMLGAATWIGA